MAGENQTQQAKQPAAPKVFNCPNCGAGVILRAFGQTVSVVCGSCGSIIDTANENYQILSKAASQLKIEPLIPLGHKGKFRGDTWEVIGFMQRTDGSGDFAWREYLLFNPFKGFRWLTEADGHWNYVIMIKDKPSLPFEKEANYLGRTFQLFEKGVASVNYVIGEFYWRVKVAERVEVEDYIQPPQMLSSEKNSEEIVWSLSEYVEPDIIRSAFSIPKAMPVRIGVAPDQPAGLSSNMSKVMPYWGIFLLTFFVIQFFNLILSKNVAVYDEHFTYRVDDTEKTKISEPFELKNGRSNIQISFSSPVQNSWLEMEGTLVNDQTGDNYDFEQGVEYYSGYDSDGSWNEGSQLHDIILSYVPAGTYHLNFRVTGPGEIQAPVTTPPNAEIHTTNWPNGAIESQVPKVNGVLEGIARYYDQDGKLRNEISWRNGERVGEKYFKPDGTPYPQVAPRPATDQAYSISVRRGVAVWLDFLLGVILLSIYPLYVWLRSRNFEQSRWSMSDYSPFAQAKESDE